MKYSVDLAALKEYAATDEAGRTNASHDVKEHRSALTEREVLQRFFRHVVPTASGDGLCTVSYTRSEVGQALVEAGLLRQARLYPRHILVVCHTAWTQVQKKVFTCGVLR